MLAIMSGFTKQEKFKMSFETEEELKFEKFKNKELENKLKSLEQENERLEKELLELKK